MPDLAGAIETAAAWPDAAVLAVENGVGADELLLGGRRSGGLIAGSLTTLGRTTRGRRDPAAVARRDRAGAGSGRRRGDDRPSRRRLSPPAACAPEPPANPAAMRWSKLLVNLMGNASGAIVDLDPVAVYRDPGLFAIERRQIGRGAGGDGRPRPPADPAVRGRHPPAADRGPPAWPAGPADPRPGRGRRTGRQAALAPPPSRGAAAGPTEVDWLNGAVAAAADQARPARPGQCPAGRAGRGVQPGSGPAGLVPRPAGPAGFEATAVPLKALPGPGIPHWPARIGRADRSIYSAGMDTTTVAVGVISIVGAYLVGGIPWGVVLARLVGGPDPRTQGSGRTGGANVLRVLGPRVAAVAADPRPAQGRLRGGRAGPARGRPRGPGGCAVLVAIIGHSRSPYIGFRGGRGVSPAFGSLIVLWPLVALIIVAGLLRRSSG